MNTVFAERLTSLSIDWVYASCNPNKPYVFVSPCNLYVEKLDMKFEEGESYTLYFAENRDPLLKQLNRGWPITEVVLDNKVICHFFGGGWVWGGIGYF